MRFGVPKQLYHDQGKEFDNKLFKQLEKLLGVRGSHTTPYHPQGNGQVEQFNRTMLQMLRTFTDEQKQDWKQHLNKVTHAYNSTPSEATGFLPHFLLFGRQPCLPVDLTFGLRDPKATEDHCENVQRWKARMEDAYYLARRNADKSAQRGQRTT